MASLADRIAFLSREPRAQIASLCDGSPRTRGEIANELARPGGSVTAHDTMVKKGALRSAGERAPGGPKPGGELLELDPSWRPALSEVLRRGTRTEVRRGAQLLLVPTAATA